METTDADFGDRLFLWRKALQMDKDRAVGEASINEHSP